MKIVEYLQFILFYFILFSSYEIKSMEVGYSELTGQISEKASKEDKGDVNLFGQNAEKQIDQVEFDFGDGKLKMDDTGNDKKVGGKSKAERVEEFGENVSSELDQPSLFTEKYNQNLFGKTNELKDSENISIHQHDQPYFRNVLMKDKGKAGLEKNLTKQEMTGKIHKEKPKTLAEIIIEQENEKEYLKQKMSKRKNRKTGKLQQKKKPNLVQKMRESSLSDHSLQIGKVDKKNKLQANLESLLQNAPSSSKKYAQKEKYESNRPKLTIPASKRSSHIQMQRQESEQMLRNEKEMFARRPWKWEHEQYQRTIMPIATPLYYPHSHYPIVNKFGHPPHPGLVDQSLVWPHQNAMHYYNPSFTVNQIAPPNITYFHQQHSQSSVAVPKRTPSIYPNKNSSQSAKQNKLNISGISKVLPKKFNRPSEAESGDVPETKENIHQRELEWKHKRKEWQKIQPSSTNELIPRSVQLKANKDGIKPIYRPPILPNELKSSPMKFISKENNLKLINSKMAVNNLNELIRTPLLNKQQEGQRVIVKEDLANVLQKYSQRNSSLSLKLPSSSVHKKNLGNQNSESTLKLNPKAEEFVPLSLKGKPDSLKMPEKSENFLEKGTMLKSKDKIAQKMDMEKFEENIPKIESELGKNLSEIKEAERKRAEISKNKNIDENDDADDEIIYQGRQPRQL